MSEHGIGQTIVPPGPPAIEPGICQNGIVVHIYALPSRRLVTVHRARTASEANYTANLDACRSISSLTVDEDSMYLVAYDGDTGERLAMGT